jgi:hypothetical protein
VEFTGGCGEGRREETVQELGGERVDVRWGRDVWAWVRHGVAGGW